MLNPYAAVHLNPNPQHVKILSQQMELNCGLNKAIEGEDDLQQAHVCFQSVLPRPPGPLSSSRLISLQSLSQGPGLSELERLLVSKAELPPQKEVSAALGCLGVTGSLNWKRTPYKRSGRIPGCRDSC